MFAWNKAMVCRTDWRTSGRITRWSVWRLSLDSVVVGAARLIPITIVPWLVNKWWSWLTAVIGSSVYGERLFWLVKWNGMGVAATWQIEVSHGQCQYHPVVNSRGLMVVPGWSKKARWPAGTCTSGCQTWSKIIWDDLVEFMLPTSSVAYQRKTVTKI